MGLHESWAIMKGLKKAKTADDGGVTVRGLLYKSLCEQFGTGPAIVPLLRRGS